MAKGTVNKVTLIGRLGQDPEIRFTGDGNAIASFSVATNESWKNKTAKFKKEQSGQSARFLEQQQKNMFSHMLKRGA